MASSVRPLTFAEAVPDPSSDLGPMIAIAEAEAERQLAVSGLGPGVDGDQFFEVIDRMVDALGATSSEPFSIAELEARLEEADRLVPPASKWNSDDVSDLRCYLSKAAFVFGLAVAWRFFTGAPARQGGAR